MNEPIAVNLSPVPDVLTSLVRDLLKAAGAALATQGILGNTVWQGITGAVLLMVPVGWGMFVTWLRSSRFATLARDPDVLAVVAKGAGALDAKLTTAPATAPLAPAVAPTPSFPGSTF